MGGDLLAAKWRNKFTLIVCTLERELRETNSLATSVSWGVQHEAVHVLHGSISFITFCFQTIADGMPGDHASSSVPARAPILPNTSWLPYLWDKKKHCHIFSTKLMKDTTQAW